MTARAVAYWFADDGEAVPVRAIQKAPFCSQSFPKEDHDKLIKALSHNFDIHATIQKPPSGWVAKPQYIRSKSAQRFVDLITPYIHLHPCFSYKIQNSKQ